MPKNHHAITIVLGIEAESDDLGRHHHNATIALGMEEEVDNLDLHDTHTTTRTMKLRWGHMLHSQDSQNTGTQRIQTTP
jgi:hypothetical protein